MVKCCIAAGCSNTYKQNVSLFIFPRDPTLRERWTRQVRRTRAGWSGPTATSYLCSNHFTEDCFDESSLMAAKLGFKKRKTLKPDTVPTVFPRTAEQKAAPPPSKRLAASCNTEPGSSQALKKARSAFEKRERTRLRKRSRCITFAVKIF